MSHPSPLDVGLDVPKESMAVADVAKAHEAEVIDRGTIGTRHADIDPLVRTLQAKATPRVFVYEAGPWGSWRSRDLTKQGQVCWGVAPALMPQQAGDRGTTDRRDAGHLARLMRSGDLTPVSGPAVADEAICDLSWACDDASSDLKAATCRLNAWLLRHASRDTGLATWGPAPLRWLADVVGATPTPQMVFQAYVRAVHEHTARLQRLEQARREQVQAWRRPAVVEALEGLRGGQCPGAVTMVAARGDLTRSENPRHVMTSLGLIPAAYASGERRRPGSIPTTGHPHARRRLHTWRWARNTPRPRGIPLYRPSGVRRVDCPAHAGEHACEPFGSPGFSLLRDQQPFIMRLYATSSV